MSTVNEAIEHVLDQCELADLRTENQAMRRHLALATEVAQSLTAEMTALTRELTEAYARVNQLEHALRLKAPRPLTVEELERVAELRRKWPDLMNRVLGEEVTSG